MEPTIAAEPLPSLSDLAVSIRLLREGDSVEALTSLLHRAYRVQVEMGLRPLAGRQTPDVTRRRCMSGECYVALLGRPGDWAASEEGDGRIVGTILFQEVEEAEFPGWFRRPDVTHFSLFAVDPEVQGHGIGRKLLQQVEHRTVELGRSEVALSMAEPDARLYAFYLHHGFRFVEYWQWPYTNYRSVIMSKTLPA